jgi:tRNA-2-methylthio-N6-dimethylallyladenosine synthase
MQRGYTAEEYKETINTIKEDFPHVKVRTQLMAGFPGETDLEFEDTLRLVDEVKFDFIEIYGFSPRPQTVAASLPDRLPKGIVTKRHYLLVKKVLRQLRKKNILDQILTTTKR